MKYVRVFADASGESHFEDVEPELAAVNYAPPAEPLQLSAEVAATGLVFSTMPLGWDGSAWHPSPTRQFFLLLSGSLEVEVSDGGRRTFGPGDVALLDDTAGRGHTVRIVGDAPVLGAFVRVSEGGSPSPPTGTH